MSNFLPFWWGMGQTDSVQTQTVAIVEPTPTKEGQQAEVEGDSHIVLELKEGKEEEREQELDEVVIVGGGEQVAPLAQEEENLSICDEDFATPEAVSPINQCETVDLFTATSPTPTIVNRLAGVGTPNSPATSPMDKTISPVKDNINGIQRCESPSETLNETI